MWNALICGRVMMAKTGGVQIRKPAPSENSAPSEKVMAGRAHLAFSCAEGSARHCWPARVPRTPVQRIGSEGGLPLPSAHTTVRTGPYTAVRKIHYLAETCSRRLRRPHCANSRLGIAACICEAPAFHQALRPVAVALRARSAHRPNATSFRYRVLG